MVAVRPSTGSGRTENPRHDANEEPFVVSLSNHERFVNSALTLVRLVEALDDLVAALHRIVQALLRRLLPRPDGLELLVHHVADLREVAGTHATRITGGLYDHLLDGHIG